jgi:hypothetical protein
MNSFKSATSLEIRIKTINDYSLKYVYTYIEITLRVYLTMPVIAAICKRSLNKIKIIENYLRSA